MGSEYNQVAYSFMRSRGQDKSITEKPIFFVVMQFSKEPELQALFKENELVTVPFLTVSPVDLKRDGTIANMFTVDQKWLIQASEVFDANK